MNTHVKIVEYHRTTVVVYCSCLQGTYAVVAPVGESWLSVRLSRN